MARDHLIPATLLGQFAIRDEIDKKTRERGIYASTPNNRAIKRRRVDNIGYLRSFYSHKPLPIDVVVGETWNAYEDRIPVAIQAVAAAGPLPLIDSWIWLKVLVPLIAGLYVRGEDFRPGKMVGEFGDGRDFTPLPEEDNINAARIPEQIRLLAPMLGAKWTIVHRAPESQPFLISDLGYALVADRLRPDGSKNVIGILVPLTPDVAVRVERQSAGPRVVAVGVDGHWKTPVNVAVMTKSDVDGCNLSICRNALRYVAGSTADLSGVDLRQLGAGRNPPENTSRRLWGTDHELATNNFEWWRLRNELSHPPDDVVCLGDASKRRLNEHFTEPPGWMPSVQLLPNPLSSISHTGVDRWGSVLKFNLYARIFTRIWAQTLENPPKLPASVGALRVHEVLQRVIG